MHSPRHQRRGDAALRLGSNGGTLRLPSTAHAALVGHALAAPPKTRRRSSALRLQRRGATTTRHCSCGVGRSYTRRAASVRRRFALRLQRRGATTTWHCSRGAGRSCTRRHRRGDAALRRGSNGGSLQLPGTAHAALVGHALAAPRLCKDAATLLCAAAPTAGCYDHPAQQQPDVKSPVHTPVHSLTLLNARCAYARRGPISKRKEYIRIFRRREHQKSRSSPGSGLRELTPQHHSFRHNLCPWLPLAPPCAPLHGARRPRTRRRATNDVLQ
jgi:hypothetical protein